MANNEEIVKNNELTEETEEVTKEVEAPAEAEEETAVAAIDADNEEDDDEDDEENHPTIFDKMSKWSEKKAILFQRIYGFMCGFVAYAVLCIEYLFPTIDQLIKYLIFVVLAVILYLSFNMGKKTGWTMMSYKLFLAIGIVAGILVHIALSLIITGHI